MGELWCFTAEALPSCGAAERPPSASGGCLASAQLPQRFLLDDAARPLRVGTEAIGLEDPRTAAGLRAAGLCVSERRPSGRQRHEPHWGLDGAPFAVRGSTTRPWRPRQPGRHAVAISQAALSTSGPGGRIASVHSAAALLQRRAAEGDHAFRDPAVLAVLAQLPHASHRLDADRVTYLR